MQTTKIEVIKRQEKQHKANNKRKKKLFKINNVEVNKISDILGNIYVLLFTPEDIGILNNEPNQRRRRFFKHNDKPIKTNICTLFKSI